MSGRIEEQPGWEPPWDGVVDRRRPTTAEYAVPWLIGVILFLIAICILLLVLLFTTEQRLGVGAGVPTQTPSSSVAGTTGTPNLTPSATPSGPPIGGPITSPVATAEPEPPEPSATPAFGELEIAFLARDQAAAPISLMRDDFSTEDAPEFVARADEGVTFHDWAPDGSVAAGIIGGRAVAIEPGQQPRPLVDNVVQITFGPDASTLYAVRVADDGVTETASVIAIDYASGEERAITELSYDNPLFGFTGPLDEAQFTDDGGAHRLYWLADGWLCLSVFDGPTVTIDPSDGTQRTVDRQPILSSPDGARRIEITQGDGGATALELLSADGSVESATTVTGVVSHLRWSPGGNRVAFTVGVATESGVRQDLYHWNLSPDEEPNPLTNSGAAFGAEWLGAVESWRV